MKINMKSSGSININGKDFVGRNVVINGDKVIIDGVTQDQAIGHLVNITVHGDVDKIENEYGTVTANNVGTIKTMSGDVKCGDVSGSASTMSGDITCGNIAGSASTMSGNIRLK